MPTAAYPITGVLAVAFLVAGLTKLRPDSPLISEFERFGYASWACRTVGLLELCGAVLLIAGIVATDHAGIPGAILLVVIMIGAIATHLRTRDGSAKLAPPSALLILLAVDIGIVLG